MIKVGGFLDRFKLKILLIICMLLDHLPFFFPIYFPLEFRYMGRIVSPIFIYLLVEGYLLTSNRLKYMKRLFIFSCSLTSVLWGITILFCYMYMTKLNISALLLNVVILWLLFSYIWLSNKCNSIKLLELYSILVILAVIGFKYVILVNLQTNMFLTMLFILLILSNFDKYRETGRFIYILNISILCVGALFTEGSYIAVILAFIFYLYWNRVKLQYIVYLIVSIIYSVYGYIFNKTLPYQVFMVFSLIPIHFYNHKKGKEMKYFFYVFYGLHLIILYIIWSIDYYSSIAI